jgi:integrase
MELSVLSRAIGNKFNVMWPKLQRLEENHDVGHALSPEEEQRLVDAAGRNRSRMIAPIIRIALVTGMRRDEIRLLTWGQIDFDQRHITVGRSKTAAGQGRMIPIGSMLESVLAGYRRWYVEKLGKIDPTHYVFPLSNRTKPVDATTPIGSFKSSWESVRETAGLKCRFHDLRHTVCTKMAEAGVPESTMKAIMGT